MVQRWDAILLVKVIHIGGNISNTADQNLLWGARCNNTGKSVCFARSLELYFKNNTTTNIHSPLPIIPIEKRMDGEAICVCRSLVVTVRECVWQADLQKKSLSNIITQPTNHFTIAKITCIVALSVVITNCLVSSVCVLCASVLNKKVNLFGNKLARDDVNHEHK